MSNFRKSNQHDMSEDTPLSVEITAFLVSQWRLIFGFALVGLLGALAVCTLLPKRYEATTLIELGSIYFIPLASGNSKDFVRSPQRLIESVNSGGFLGRGSIAPASNATINGSLSKSNKLVSLRVIAPSKEGAKDALLRAVIFIEESSAAEHARYKSRLSRSLELAQNQAASIAAYLNELKTITLGPGAETKDPSLAVLSSQFQVYSFTKLSQLENEILETRDILTSLENSPIKIIEPIQVKDNAVYPNTLLIASLSTIATVILGALVAFLNFTPKYR